jgi:hypothetical protein
LCEVIPPGIPLKRLGKRFGRGGETGIGAEGMEIGRGRRNKLKPYYMDLLELCWSFAVDLLADRLYSKSTASLQHFATNAFVYNILTCDVSKCCSERTNLQ